MKTRNVGAQGTPQRVLIQAGTSQTLYGVRGFVPKTPPTGATYQPTGDVSQTLSNMRVANAGGWAAVLFTAGAGTNLELYVAQTDEQLDNLPLPPQYGEGVSSASVMGETTLTTAYQTIDSGLGSRSMVTIWLDDKAPGAALVAFSSTPSAGATLLFQPGRSMTLPIAGALRIYAKAQAAGGAGGIFNCVEA